MIVIWDKKTRKVIYQTSDDSQYANYSLYAQQHSSVGFLSKASMAVFPEPGYKIDMSGNYVPLSYAERVANGSAPAPTNLQKVIVRADGTESLEYKSNEELIATGTKSLDDFRASKKNFLYQSAVDYLNRSVTPQNKYPTSEAAQKICIATMALANTPDTDPNKILMIQSGLLFTVDKAKEILAFCSAVMASFRSACKAVDEAINLAQLDSIQLSTYL